MDIIGCVNLQCRKAFIPPPIARPLIDSEMKIMLHAITRMILPTNSARKLGLLCSCGHYRSPHGTGRAPIAMRGIGTWVLASSLVAAIGFALQAADSDLPAEQVEFFEKNIRPLLVEHCYGCHSAQATEVKGGLRLDSRAGLLQGGNSGPAIVPGNVDNSLLIQAVRYGEDSVQMPPKGKLPEEKIQLLERWVAMGAPDPRGGDAASNDPSAARPADVARTHWAFRPPTRPRIPAVRDATWPRGNLDVYLLARLEEIGLAPAPEADRSVLIRRLYIDLTGLPPRYEEIAEFLADTSADAYERLVDRLLASPRFGERWGRHWLDVARYADTKGYVFQEDRSYPEAYTYRDWVIQTLNQDLPYDQFLRYQIAADQLPPLENLTVPTEAAMGFFTLGRRFLNNKHDIIDDRIDVLTRGMLGLTVTCARCHDHKYDPISMRDYYALYGVFDSSVEPKNGPSPLRLADSDQPHNARILLRGQPGNPGPEVPRRFLAVLCRGEPEPFRHGSGRRELADATASAENPLTARVIVNRLWLHLFGEGLVATPSDFGVRCEPPAQPEVLDYLATRLIEHGWSLKAIIREIVTSSAYRQSSLVSADVLNKDPQNRYFGRQNRRRLDFEAMRDALLWATDQLDLTMGGPSVDITQEPYPRRRSVYAYIDRQNLPGVFRVFDFAGPDTHSPRRPETTTPQQALYLMNHPFVIQLCEQFLKRSIEAPDVGALSTANASGGQGTSDLTTQWIRAVFRRLLARDPDAGELELAKNFLATAAADSPAAAPSPWQYGYGQFHEDSNRCSFSPLPHFTGQAWQGGPSLPDPQLGWVLLNARGGHPGDPSHAAIRRWTAPAAGTVQIRGLFVHPSQEGDGVRGRIVSSRQGKLGEWVAQNNHQRIALDAVQVEAGETLDFVVDCRESVNDDSFQWTVRIAYTTPVSGALSEFRSENQFQGPALERLSRPAQFVQLLLMSNEFHFVD